MGNPLTVNGNEYMNPSVCINSPVWQNRRNKNDQRKGVDLKDLALKRKETS